MRTITLERKPLDYRDFIKRSALDSDAPEVITQDTTLRDARTGHIMAIYKTGLLTGEMAAALKAIRYQKNTRANGLTTTSKIFGYRPRFTLRQDYCSQASLSVDQPDLHRVVAEYGRKVAGIYLEHWPSMALAHAANVKAKVRPEWMIEGTPFTSGIVNKNNPLKYHLDRGNFKGVASCMAAFRSEVSGGRLAMPEYGVSFEIADGSVTIFDGQDILHGVTPIVKTHRDGYRFTVVYYSLAQMWKCETLDGELARIRNLKTVREAKRIGKL